MSGPDTDELEEGHEECPICGRINFPGACDTCEHCIGLMWDDQITNSENFDDFQDAWSDFCEIRDRLENQGMSDLDSKIKEIAVSSRIDTAFVDAGISYDFDADQALIKVCEFREGLSISTDGMLSGEGCWLYHKDPKVLTKLAKSYRKLIAKVVAKFGEGEV